MSPGIVICAEAKSISSVALVLAINDKHKILQHSIHKPTSSVSNRITSATGTP